MRDVRKKNITQTAAGKFICCTVHAAVSSSTSACSINHSFCSHGEGDIFLTCEWCPVLSSQACAMLAKLNRRKQYDFVARLFRAMSNNKFIRKAIFSSTPRHGCISTNGSAPLINFFHIQNHHNSDTANFDPRGEKKAFKNPWLIPHHKADKPAIILYQSPSEGKATFHSFSICFLSMN